MVYYQPSPFPKQSKYLLWNFIQLKTGETLATVASKNRLSYQSLTIIAKQVPNRENRKTRKILASYLGVPYEVLWGPNSNELLEEEIQKELIKKTVQNALDFYGELRARTYGKEDKHPVELVISGQH